MMPNSRDAIQLRIQRLQRTKWIVLGVTYTLVALMVVMNYWGPLMQGPWSWKGLVNLLMGWVIAWVMINIAYSHAGLLLEQLYQMAISRKEIEAQLRVQSAALESAANAIVITDADGRITWANRAFTKLTGYTLEEAVNQTPRLLRSGKHEPPFYTNLWDTIRDGRVWQGEITNRRKDHSLYIEEMTITPVLDENGQISHFIAIKQDITQRRQIEKVEQERREWAEALRETSLALNASLDFDGVLDCLLEQIGRIVLYDTASLMIIEDGKARIARQIGYDQISPELDRIIAALVFDLAETEGLQTVVASRQPVIVSNVADYSGWVYGTDVPFIQSWVGAPIIVQNEVVALFSLDKKEPGFYQPEHAHLLETFTAQVALAWHNAHLFAEARRRARELDLLNRVIGGTAVAQNDTELLQIGCMELARFFEVDQTVAVLFDAAKTKVVVVAEVLTPGLPSLLGTSIPVEGNPILQRLFETGEPLVIAQTSALPLPLPMAMVLTQRGVESVLMVPFSVRGQIVGAIGIHARPQREFTAAEIRLVQMVGEELGQSMEMIRLNEQLRTHTAELEDRVTERTQELAEANVQLQELDHLKSKFVSDVSHELRTPITNFGMYLDLLEHGRADKKAHYVNVLKKETARIRRLVEDILDLSQLEASWAKSAAFELVDLNQIAGQVVITQSPNAQDAGLLLTFEPSPELPLILGEPRQLAQVVTNLLANAINYTPEGEIAVVTYQENGEVCLKVQDTGMGVDEEDMPYLFDRFYRGRQMAQLGVPGTGLGLGIVKEIVDLHGGRVGATSEAGRGSTFCVWLTAVTEGG